MQPTKLKRKGPPLDEFGEVLKPTEAQEPILSKPVRSALTEWLTEIWAEKELNEVGLKPRKRALFHGAPGTGKTTLAHHLAARLGLNMCLVRPDRIVDSLLGSTGQNLGNLFDAAKEEGPVVLFFDEFEALAAARQSSGRDAQREMNSVVNVMLQRFDAHDGYIIAATNHGDQLDSAVWRRFDMQIEIETPGQKEREHILARYLAPYGLPKSQLVALADACGTATPALLQMLCEGIKRNLVVGPQVGWPMGREAVFTRVIAAIEPHQSLGKPRLWSHGADDKAVSAITWPLHKADALPKDEAPAARPAPDKGKVISLRGEST